MQNYLLDACALIAFSDSEEGEPVVKELLQRARRGEINISIHAANLIEVYYDRIRAVGSEEADKAVLDI
jgi:PIN domain nuclease of toxin-antitoxin system